MRVSDAFIKMISILEFVVYDERLKKMLQEKAIKSVPLVRRDLYLEAEVRHPEVEVRLQFL